MNPTDPSRTTDEPATPDLNSPTASAVPAPGDPTRTGGAAGPDAVALPELDPPRDPAHLGRIDHYEIVGILGHGGMGVVLKAHDEALDRVVALKVLAPHHAASPAARQRFIREARAAAAVTHDNVVTVHAVVDRVPYLVMQYVPGRSLQARLDADGPPPVETVVRIGAEIAAGLAAAHARGLVHRDVKPSNVLLEPGTGRVKITDFGLARAVDDETVTRSGGIVGTPLYMSPEQARGDPVDARSDLFSLGSVLYAMCTGQAPFRASGTMAVLRRVIEDDPRPLAEANPAVPEWLGALVHRLLAKDPGRRFPTADGVARLLADHLTHLQHPDRYAPPPAELPVPAAGRRDNVPPGPTPPPPDRPRQSWWANPGVRIGLALVVISVAIAVGVLMGDRATRSEVGPSPTAAVEDDPPLTIVKDDPAPMIEEETVYRTILDDVQTLPARDLLHARYLSLRHLRLSPVELAGLRTEFLSKLGSLLQAGAPIHPVDPEGTVFRIDLEKAGWDTRPFFKVDNLGKAAAAVPFNLYDLVLLEYPHAVVPNGSAVFDQVVEKFLVPAGQVRPVAFVRGDWFVATVTGPPLAAEVSQLMKRRTGTAPPGLVPDPQSKRPAVPGVGPRAPGTPLPALDAWHAAADPPDPTAGESLTVSVLDAKTRAPRDVFFPDDVFSLRVQLGGSGPAPAHLQYVYINVEGLVEVRSGVEPVEPRGRRETPDLPNGGFAPMFGTERVRVFAAPHRFPAGEVWRVKDMNLERLVHDFFPIRKDRAGPYVDLTDTKVTRKTVEIRVAEPKRK
ncbi:MAG TPA: serine/threonine-protein kinase [Gemmataceae bacterium]|nr:serine/threonine-protein kinase [Gemmataceae bacterium]